MAYKIYLSNEVKQKIFDIADYWIEFYSNFEFANIFYSEYKEIEKLLIDNPNIFPLYKNKNNIHKIVMFKVKYNLYYYVINNTVTIIDIKAFKEEQWLRNLVKFPFFVFKLLIIISLYLFKFFLIKYKCNKNDLFNSGGIYMIEVLLSLIGDFFGAIANTLWGKKKN